MKSVAIRVHLWLKVLTLKNPVTTIFNSISFRINTNVHHPHFPGVEYGRMVLTRPTSSTPPPHHTRVQPVPTPDFPKNSKICRKQPTGPMKTKDFSTNENPKITQNNPPRGSAMPFRGLELTPKATAKPANHPLPTPFSPKKPKIGHRSHFYSHKSVFIRLFFPAAAVPNRKRRIIPVAPPNPGLPIRANLCSSAAKGFDFPRYSAPPQVRHLTSAAPHCAENTLISLRNQDFHGKMLTVAIAAARTLILGLVVSCVFSAHAAASWVATGPFGGDADIVRAIPQAKGHVVAAARNGLIYYSSNGGASWTNLPFPAEFSGVLHALEVDPKVPGTWYAGVESEYEHVSGVYKTTDAGLTWAQLPGTVGVSVWSLAIWQGDRSVIAAGSSTGVFLTRDAGQSWKRISPEDNEEIRPVVSLAFHPADSNMIYAGTTHLPWRTADGGTTWQSIHTGMLDDSDVFSIQVDNAQPDHVMASACSGVYNSDDGAGHWARMETPPGAFRTHFVALDPRHSGVVFAGTTQALLKSENGGHTWRVVSNFSVRSLSFDPAEDGRIFFAAASGGVLISTDEGNTLHESNVGFANRNFMTLASAGSALYSTSVYDSGSGGVYRTDNYGLQWLRAAGPSGDELIQMAADPDEPKHLYAAGYHGFYESRDGGMAWTSRKGPSDAAQVTSLMPLPGGVLLAGTPSGMFRTTIGRSAEAAHPVKTAVPARPSAAKSGPATSWTRSLPDGIQSLQLSIGNRIAALTARGALISDNNGLTWKACGTSGPSGTWYGLAFGTPLEALAATTSGLYRSTDGCATWSLVHDGLDPATVGLVIFHPTHPNEAFASQGGRIFVSTDGGQRWLSLDEDAGGSAGPASLVVLSAFPDRLFALFPRRGVYSTRIGMWNAVLDTAQADTMSTVAFRPRND